MARSYIEMVDKVDKLPIYTELDTLNIYCEYLFNDKNKIINYSNLMNMKEFIGYMSIDTLMTSDSKMARYYFIKYFLEAKIDLGITSKKLILNYIKEKTDSRYYKLIDREVLSCIQEGNLSNKDIEFVNGMIFAHLNSIFMHKYKGAMMQMIEDINMNEFPSYTEEGIALFQRILTDLTRAQRRSKQENRFNLTDKTLFRSIMREACDRALSDSQFWMTGWQGLNVMLNGGLENGRVYNIIGGTGGFKSGFLLNLMKSIKLYNENKPSKDPTKRKTILFVSQENNIWETIIRIFNIFATSDSIKNYGYTEIMNLLKKGGFRLVADEQEIDIEFRYYGNEDIGVPDLKGMVEELSNEGREVICIIQDYIERLRPPNRKAERRLQLSDISNQLHDLAIYLDIPIVTASQFNKEGVSVVEDMRNSNKADIGRNLGTKNISESFGMLKNIDVNIIIVIEYDVDTGKYYLSFNKIKFRGADEALLTYFLQPFDGINKRIMLMDDVNKKEPLFKLSLNKGIPDNLKTNEKTSARKRKDISELHHEVSIDVGPQIEVENENDLIEVMKTSSKSITLQHKDHVDVSPDTNISEEDYVNSIRNSMTSTTMDSYRTVGKYTINNKNQIILIPKFNPSAFAKK